MTDRDRRTGMQRVGGGTAAETLSVMTKTRHVRYLQTLFWGLCVAGMAGPQTGVLWACCAGAAIVIRSMFEARAARRDRGYGVVFPLVATLTVVVWSGAPLLCWFAPNDFGRIIGAILLGSGFMNVFSQFRAAPRYALLVSSPYVVVQGLFAASLWGQPGFWTFMAATAALAAALVVYQAMSLTARAEQRMLIAQLEAARDEADRANAAKSAFLGVISHELRTPMNGVLGAAQLLNGTPLNDEQTRFLDIIRDSGDGLLSLLNDMLDLTKIEAGAMTIEPAPIALETLLARVTGPWGARAEAKGLAFEVRQAADLPIEATLDMQRVAQILHNLLNNAVKFTDAGRVVLDVGCERLGPGRAQLTLSVTDTGVGITPEDAARLFQPFVQVDGSATRRFAGTGLGLNICRRLAELMGGTVSVTSESGQGSTFTFVLPVEATWRAAANTEVHLEPTAVEHAQAAMRVLVVEDHPVNRQLLETWLGVMGHETICAENGQIALDLAAEQAFDLILMDVRMPVMDGLTATRRLRAEPGPNQETPLVVLSASARAEDHECGLLAGADAYLNKPIDFEALAQVLALSREGRTALAGEKSVAA